MKTRRSHLKIRVLAALVLVVGFAGSISMPPVPAYACNANEQEVAVPVDQGGTTCVPINNNGTAQDITNSPIFFYLRNFLYFLAGGVGLAVVGGIVTGAYMYITARANAAQVQKGQDTITNSVIGLLLFIFMYAILQFVIPGGVFR